MTKKILLAFLLLSFLSFSFAFSQEVPTSGFLSPYSSVAQADDALSIGFNPAGLGWERENQTYLLHSYTDSSFKGNTGIFLSAGNLGFSVEWLGYQLEEWYRKYTIAGGFKLVDKLYFGSSYSWFGSKIKEYDDLSSWNIGFLARLCPFSSIGFVVKDLNRPKFGEEMIDRSYHLGVALRPLSDRITFSVDGLLYEYQKIKDLKTRYRAEIEIWDGLILSGDIDNDGNLGINARINLPRAGFGSYHHFKKDNKTEGVVYLNTSKDRYRSWFQPKNNFLELKLSGEILEEPKRFFIFGPKRKSMFELINTIHKAKEDRTVKGILIRLEPLDIGWAKAQEIREAILDFRKTGKKVLCFMELGSDKEYYLACACDKIIMAPSGYLGFDGLASEVTFIKGTLDKLGIKAELEHIGDYKTASDLVTRDKMSDAHREVVNSILDDFYFQLTEGVAESRGLSRDEVKSAIDNGPYTANEAFEAGLVDTLAYYDELEDMAEKMIVEKPHKIKFKEYSERKYYQYSWAIPPKIAVIFATGMILSGESDDNFLFGKIMGAETIASAIKKAREDKSIKAIVFRVDSPGGSGIASDAIWREIGRTKGKKPFVVSMSDVAGSGGYFISCLADTIFAMPATYTGSIGVISGKFDLSGLYKKIGFSKETVKRGEHADFFTSTRSFTKEEREIVKRQIKEFYDDFVRKVSEGREIPFDSVHQIAQGRVWTGNQGKENGLVDELGGLRLAIACAKKMAGISQEKEIKIVTLPKRRWALSLGIGQIFSKSLEFEPLFKELEKIEFLEDERILFLVPYQIEIE